MPPCFFDAQLIGLHLPQVAWLFDQILVHGLALMARAGPPRRYGALVKPKSGCATALWDTYGRARSPR